MKTFEVEITGITPLMQHRMPEEALLGLLGAKQDKKKATEELTPRQIAAKHAYANDKGEFYIPMSYIVGAFKHVASDYKQKNTSRKSIKTIAAGIFCPETETAPLLCLEDKPLGDFEVDIQKGNNHQRGAVAVCRPRFDRWKSKFRISIDDSVVATQICLDILADAGKRSGIGSFRVAKGGPYGKFQVTKWEEI